MLNKTKSGKNINTMNEFTTETIKTGQNSSAHDIVPMYLTIDSSKQPLTLTIECDSITLKQNNISICFCSEKDIKQLDNIIINGIKFKKAEEENE